METDKGMEPRELALSTSISLITETLLKDTLAKAPLYEVIWSDMQKESSWKPALSLIPVSRESKFKTNVHVYQHFETRDSSVPFYAHYEGFTPRDDTVIVSGIEVGTVLDFPIPRGILLFATNTKWQLLDNYEGGAKTKDTPIWTVMKKEIDNQKVSKLFESVRNLASDSQYTATIRLGPRGVYSLSYPAYFMLAPRGSRTVAMVSTCAAPLGGFKKKLPIGDGYTVNYEFGFPSPGAFMSAVNVVKELARRAENVKCLQCGTAKVPEIASELMLYLLLESAKRTHAAHNERLSFQDVFSAAPSEATKELFSLLPEGKELIVAEGRVTRKETAPVAKLLKCPKCGAVYSYREDQILPSGQVKCQNCLVAFGVEPG